MRYNRFEELPVWQSAIEFALKVFDLTDKADFRGLGDTKGSWSEPQLPSSIILPKVLNEFLNLIISNLKFQI